MFTDDNYLNSFYKTQQKLNRLATPPFNSLFKEQLQIAKNFSQWKELAESAKQMSYLTQSLPDILYKQFGLATMPPDAYAQYSDLIASINQSFGISKNATVNAITPDVLNQLVSNIRSIAIHEDFVSIPEALIPDDFQYEEVSDTSSIALEQNVEQTTNTINLSLSNALALLNFITMILVFLLAPFYNYAIENTLSKKAEVKPSAPITEEQTQQMLNYLSDLIDYQQAILTTLETSYESAQESVSAPSGTDSTPSNADFDPQCVPSQPDLVEELHPTEADGYESSEPH